MYHPKIDRLDDEFWDAHTFDTSGNLIINRSVIVDDGEGVVTISGGKVYAEEMFIDGKRVLDTDDITSGASITGAEFVTDDIVFTKNDGNTVILEDAKITLTGPTGPQGDIGPAGPAGPSGVIEPIYVEEETQYVPLLYNLGDTEDSSPYIVNPDTMYIDVGNSADDIVVISNLAIRTSIYNLQSETDFSERFGRDVSNSGAMYCVAFGYRALQLSGSHNCAFGSYTLHGENGLGAYNDAVGAYALYSNTDGSHNNAVGYQSLYSNTTGNDNTAIGTETLYSNTVGNYNNAIGYQSLYNNTTGEDNNAVGRESLYNNTTGYENIAVGTRSIYNNTTGYENIAIGTDSLYSNTDGSHNIAVGNSALYSNTDGSDNIVIGNYDTLPTGHGGGRNVCIGHNCPSPGPFGNENIIIGYHANQSTDVNHSNTICIGDGIVPEGDETCRIKYIYGSSSSSGTAVLVNSDHVLGTTTSSLKYKKDIEPLTDEYADKIFDVEPVFYKSKCERDNDEWSWYGVIAEQVAEVDPRFAVWDFDKDDYHSVEKTRVVKKKIPKEETYIENDETKTRIIYEEIEQNQTYFVNELKPDAVKKPVSVDYGRFTPHLINIIKRQKIELDNLKNKIEVLDNLIERIEVLENK